MVGCVSPPTEFTEFTEVWGAVGCVGMAGCHTLLHLCKSVLSVGDSSLPEGSVCSVHSVGFIPACFVGAVLALTVGKVELRLLDSGGSVGMAGCHTLLICAHLCQSVGGTSLPECSVRSVGSVEGASLPEGSVRSVRSVGDIPACFVGAVLALAGGKAELRLLDSRGSVGMAGCHTLLICAHPCQSVGGTSLPEGSVCSVRSVGATSLPEGSVLSVRSVGGTSQPEE